jgi:Holliday junction resolvase RusA-like endonuclease
MIPTAPALRPTGAVHAAHFAHLTLPVEVRLVVPGLPAPQGSKRFMRHRSTGKAIGLEDSPRTRDWRALVASEARFMAARLREADPDFGPLDGPLFAALVFWLPRPASAPKRRRYPDAKPDLSKLLRAVEDSLSGVLIRDDARIVRASLAKDFGEPGCLIELGRMPQEAPLQQRLVAPKTCNDDHAKDLRA